LSRPGAPDGQIVDLDSPGAYQHIGGYRGIIQVGACIIAVAYVYGIENRQVFYGAPVPVFRLWPLPKASINWPGGLPAFRPQTINAFKDAKLRLAPEDS